MLVSIVGIIGVLTIIFVSAIVIFGIMNLMMEGGIDDVFVDESDCPPPTVFIENFGCAIVDPPQTNLITITVNCPSGFIQPSTIPIAILDFDDSYVACINTSTLFLSAGTFPPFALELHCGDFYLPDPDMPSTFIECIVDGVLP